jgi:hypothetical protein
LFYANSGHPFTNSKGIWDGNMAARILKLSIVFKMNKSTVHSKKHEDEIYLNAWDIFSSFVHPNAPNFIPFNQNIVKDFSQIVEAKREPATFNTLEHVIEGIYQEVCRKMFSLVYTIYDLVRFINISNTITSSPFVNPKIILAIFAVLLQMPTN